MNRPRSFLTLAATIALAGLLLPGCDPKLTGVDDSGTGTGPGDPTPASVADQAIAVGNILSLHMDLVHTSLVVSADYDSSDAAIQLPSGLPTRGMLSQGCVALNQISATPRVYELDLSTCTDSNGTTYRGRGELQSDAAVDGYVFYPDPLVDSMIIAINDSNDSYNHTYDSGNIEIIFDRDGGGNPTDLHLANFVRHLWRSEIITFSYDTLPSYSGAPGSHSDWPTNGSVVRVIWDSVGIFDVTFSGTSSATFRLLGLDYTVDLNTGKVSLT